MDLKLGHRNILEHLSPDREIDAELGSCACGASQVDVALVLAYDFLRARQPQTNSLAFTFRREKRIEDAALNVIRDPNASIGDIN